MPLETLLLPLPDGIRQGQEPLNACLSTLGWGMGCCAAVRIEIGRICGPRRAKNRTLEAIWSSSSKRDASNCESLSCDIQERAKKQVKLAVSLHFVSPGILEIIVMQHSFTSRMGRWNLSCAVLCPASFPGTVPFIFPWHTTPSPEHRHMFKGS